LVFYSIHFPSDISFYKYSSFFEPPLYNIFLDTFLLFFSTKNNNKNFLKNKKKQQDYQHLNIFFDT